MTQPSFHVPCRAPLPMAVVHEEKISLSTRPYMPYLFVPMHRMLAVISSCPICHVKPWCVILHHVPVLLLSDSNAADKLWSRRYPRRPVTLVASTIGPDAVMPRCDDKTVVSKISALNLQLCALSFCARDSRKKSLCNNSLFDVRPSQQSRDTDVHSAFRVFR
jgi:hypothetical protein